MLQISASELCCTYFELSGSGLCMSKSIHLEGSFEMAIKGPLNSKHMLAICQKAKEVASSNYDTTDIGTLIRLPILFGMF